MAKHQLVVESCVIAALIKSFLLAKCLSSIGGTACFDKSPQSQSRGITLDLGFSSFKLSDEANVTIVDCPGHANLIRTVLCGAQIIDLVVLVIDGTKGIQAQTAECLILAEIMTDRLVFLVNKIDLWPEGERMSKFGSIKNKLKAAMRDGKFSDSPILPFSTILNLGIDEIKGIINDMSVRKPIKRNTDDGFVFAVDHCFPIKGQGTIFTGTVLQGRISVNETIEIPQLQSKKIKSIQRFRESVKGIEAGDRAGICVAQSSASVIDTESIDRTLISSTSNPIPNRKIIILKAKRVKWFKGDLRSKSKMHVSVLNEVVLCKQLIFVRPTRFGYQYLEAITEEEEADFSVIIELEKAIRILNDSIVIVSKFDSDPSLQKCRIAFHGRWQQGEEEEGENESDFLIYRPKERTSLIDRLVDEHRIIGKGFNAKSASKFIGMNVSIFDFDNKETAIGQGRIDSLFGSSGKFNVTLTVGSLDSSSFKNKNLFVKLTFGKVMTMSKEKETKIFCIS